MAIGAEYLTSVGSALGITAIQAGIILSLVFTVGIMITVILGTKGRQAQVTIPLSTLFPTVLFTFMGWYPVWTGSALALVLSIFIAYTFSRW